MTKYERPVDYNAVVLYDADCPYCSAATKALRQIDGLGAVSWGEEVAQSFLESQFGETPFAITLVDGAENRVYVGRDAAKELATRAGLPDMVSDLVGTEFDWIESAVETLGGHEEQSDDWHGVYELSNEGEIALDHLQYNAWSLPSR